MSTFQKVADALTARYPIYRTADGAELLKILKKVVDPENAHSAYGNIAKAIKFARDIRGKRHLRDKSVVDADPLAIARIFAELHSDKTTVVNERAILAAILYPVLHIERANPFALPEKSQIEIIDGFLEQIGGREAAGKEKKVRGLFGSSKLNSEVEALTRNTLQISEINLGGSTSEPHANPGADPEERLRAFRHMVMEVVKDPDAVLLRGMQWLVHMRQLTKNYEKDPTPKDAEKIKECLDLTTQVYIPLVSAYGHSALMKKIEDQFYRMADPDGYARTQEWILQTARNVTPEHREKYINSLSTAKRITPDALKNELHKLLPPELRDHVQIESNLKNTFETTKKVGKKGADSIVDIARARMIVDVALPEDAPLEEIWESEGKVCSRLLGAIHHAAKKSEVISTLDEDEARYIQKYREMKKERMHQNAENEPTQGQKQNERKDPTQDEVEKAIQEEDKKIPEKVSRYKFKRPVENYYANPKETDYRGIHIIFIINKQKGEKKEITDKDEPARFELQIVGKRPHENNQHGTAAHDGVYKNKDLPTKPDITAPYTVSVFTPGNDIIELSRPATATDYLVRHAGVDKAFSANFVQDKRHASGLLDKNTTKDDREPLAIGHGTMLQPADTVLYTIAPELLNNPAHRMHVIDSCLLPATRNELMRRHHQLLTIEKNEASRPGPGSPGSPSDPTL